MSDRSLGQVVDEARHPAGEAFTKWATVAARAAEDKLGTNTIVVDVAEVLGLTDLFVITTGANPRQVRAIANNIEEELARADGPKPLRSEGRDSYEWVLIDFGGFMCHIFDEDHRAYYELERLWGDRPKIVWRETEKVAVEPDDAPSAGTVGE